MMPARDCAETLQLAVASVLAQTYRHWELLIVEPDLEQQASEILESMHDRRIRFLTIPQASATRGAARQAALDQACGEFVAYLDADDWMYTTRMETQLAWLMSAPNCAVVSGGIVVESPSGTPFGRLRAPNSRHSWAQRTLASKSPVLNASSMIRTAVAQRYRYDTSMQHGEDSDFLRRVLNDNTFCFQPEPQYVYRLFQSLTVGGIRAGLRSARDRELGATQNRAQRTVAYARWIAKRTFYRAQLRLLGKRGVVSQRCQALTADDCARFAKERAQVRRALRIAGPVQ